MKTVLAAVAILVLFAAGASAGSIGRAVQVSIVTDSGRTLPLYPTAARAMVRKAYAEAIKGENYRIVVRNNLDRRVGVVVAVDGRNIISGQKSWLGNNERMYIIDPYATGEYNGWRTSQDQVNRFYFSEVADSYAAAFKDESAMGVIAVAVYPEIQRCKPQILWDEAVPAAPAPAGVMEKSRAGTAARAEADNAGTGYGRSEYSPSYRVKFDPETTPRETIYLKYEWRSTLCRLGVVSCGEPRLPANRLWDDGGYAPPPPRR